MKQPEGNINIGIADDHRILVNSLQTYLGLKEEMDVIFSASNGNELMEKMEMFPPHIVLIDIKLPGKSVFQCIKEIKEKYPKTAILVLSDTNEQKLLLRCLTFGANGIIDQSAQGAELVRAIKTILEKEIYLNDYISKILYSQLNPNINPDPVEHLAVKLNPKEREIIKHLYREKSCKEIAQLMNLTERSIEAYRHRIIGKLGVKSSIGIVRFAIENDLIWAINYFVLNYSKAIRKIKN